LTYIYNLDAETSSRFVQTQEKLPTINDQYYESLYSILLSDRIEQTEKLFISNSVSYYPFFQKRKKLIFSI